MLVLLLVLLSMSVVVFVVNKMSTWTRIRMRNYIRLSEENWCLLHRQRTKVCFPWQARNDVVVVVGGGVAAGVCRRGSWVRRRRRSSIYSKPQTLYRSRT